ncbi:DUF397 domain-containing protein [Streptomyces sp. NPDC096176]|uniref:DUF397 domain-containing protein n=1 Tax=Streptomyces sp. NPDC096176 TaxID=3366079 RepID=UPI003821F131
MCEQKELMGVEFVNGMQASALDSVRWIKSSHSNATGNCVEMAALPDGRIAVRNSRDPHGPALVCTRDGFSGFVAAVGEGNLAPAIG